MRFPTAPSQFISRAADVQADLRRIRTSWQELLDYLRDLPTDGGLTEAEADALYLKRIGNDWSGFGATVPQLTDRVLIESAANGFDKRYAEYQDFDPWRTGSKPLYVPPLVASALDDEFEGSTLDAAWAFYDATADVNRTPSGAVDPFTNLTGAATVPRVTVGQRESHVKFQTTDSNVFYFMHKAATLPTTCFLWCRAGTTCSAAGTSRTQLFISPDNGGKPNVTQTGSPTSHMIAVGLYSSAGAITQGLSTISAGGGEVVTAVDATESYPYFGIYKDGSNIYPLCFNDDGRTFEFGSISIGWTIGRVGVRVRAQNGGFGAPVHDVDFIREDTTWRF